MIVTDDVVAAADYDGDVPAPHPAVLAPESTNVHPVDYECVALEVGCDRIPTLASIKVLSTRIESQESELGKSLERHPSTAVRHQRRQCQCPKPCGESSLFQYSDRSLSWQQTIR